MTIITLIFFFIAISNIYVLCVVVFSDHCRYKVDMIVGLFGVHRGADLSHICSAYDVLIMSRPDLLLCIFTTESILLKLFNCFSILMVKCSSKCCS